MMREEHRLGPLQMGVARHDHVEMPPCLPDERALEIAQRMVQPGQGGSKIQTKVRRHLVVAAPARVQFSSDRPEELSQPPLDSHMNVFILRPKRKSGGVE